MLEYVREEGSIKGVVVSLDSPGGAAAPSEELFFEMLRLKDKKPVVLVMDDLVASGGFMMAMGANYTLAKPSSFEGGVGVILSPCRPYCPTGRRTGKVLRVHSSWMGAAAVITSR